MKEMIKNYRGTLISSGLVILAGILVGFTSIQGKWLNVFFIVMQCVLVTIIFYDNRNRQQSRKVIAYTQIDSISYEENLLQNSNDYRTNGLGNFKYAMGNFRNDVYGNYIRYTHSSCHSYVVMSVDGKILVINGENDSATEEIYHTISEKMSRELE